MLTSTSENQYKRRLQKVLAIYVLFCVLMTLLIWRLYRDERQQVIATQQQEIERELRSMTDLLDLHFANALTDLGLVEQWFNDNPDKANMDALFKRISAGKSLVSAYAISNAKGEIAVIYPDPGPIKTVLSIGDRPYFIAAAHSLNSGSRLGVAAPTKSRLNGRWVLPVFKIRESHENRFGGLSILGYDLEVLQELLQPLQKGDASVVALLNTPDAQLLHQFGTTAVSALEAETKPSPIRYPSPAAIEQTLAEHKNVVSPLAHKTDQHRVWLVRPLQNAPLILSLSFVPDEMVALWQRDTLMSMSILLLIILVVGGLIVVVWWRNERAGQRLHAQVKATDVASTYLSSIMDTVVDGLIVIDERGRIELANPAAQKLFGYSLDELKGQNVNILMPTPYTEAHDGYLHNYLSTGNRQIIGIGREVRGRRKDGSIFPMELAVSEMQFGNQRVFTGLVRDISLRKADEEAIAKQVQATLEASIYLRSIMDTVADGLLVIDQRGLIEMANPAALQLFGYAWEEIQSKNVKMLMPPPYANAHDEYLSKYLSTGVKRKISIEVHGKRKDGSIFPMDLSVSEMKVGERLLFAGLIRDITERKKVEAELVIAKDTAEKASSAKSEFLSRMSHELRTPLNAILGFGQLLAMDRKTPLTTEQHENVDDILRGGRHLLALINEVLDLERIESGRVSIEHEPIDISDLTTQCLKETQELARARGVTMTLLMNAESGRQARVIGDRLRVRQILLNLISNAIKYNRSNGEIILSLLFVPPSDQQSGRWRVLVKDSGIGIAAQYRDRIFQPFDRLGQADTEIEGTGIGLSISKQLVERMNGAIGYESGENGGSIFWFELPIAEAVDVVSSASADVAIEGHYSTDINRSGDAIIVVYIEDNLSNVKVMQRVVAAHYAEKVQLLIATNVERGLALVRQVKPRLILMDLNLPDMHGIDAIKILKGDAETVNIPVIAVSADAMTATINEARLAGANDFVIKPFDMQLLLDAMNRQIAVTQR